MDSYTLIFVRDAHARPVQLAIPKKRVKQTVIGVVVAALVLLVGLWDYWRVRADNRELAGLRIEAMEQREQIALFESRLEKVDGALSRVGELERKVRIIANLPGSAGVGGEDVVELAPEMEGDAALPVGVPVDRTPPPGTSLGQGGGTDLEEDEASSAGVAVLQRLDGLALDLASHAVTQADSLDELLVGLEDKRQRLVSSPSIWPAKGWLTSRFGPRVSPFTGRRQMHAGIDIASADGTAIQAPARGRVTFVGNKGPLGKALVLDHGFGVKTVYGHTKTIVVKTGETVERGQKIAEVGSTGRSTGPHLHYVVEVNGKARDPLDYIFD
ncbi:MAG: M23 family metallopeptidase [Spirochaetaceae bacterium]|nr:M23 family metallopeptidase [Myxococcales bacterium]MCB9726546.1 M23 family metallopeptidase [Spirochaetaceae bacterium]